MFRDYEKEVTISVGDGNEATLFHGNDGFFGDPCVERDIVTTIVNPFGILADLEAFDTTNESPIYGLLTGFVENGEAEPATVCEDGPTGAWEACRLSSQFGDMQRCMNTVEAGKIIMKACRGDMGDLRLRGRVLGNMGKLDPNMSEADMLNVIVRSEMVGVAKLFHNKMGRVIWTGDPVNSVGTGYLEPYGLDNLVVTGHTDAISAAACADVDSYILDSDPLDTGTYQDFDCAALRSLFGALHELEIRGMSMAPINWKIYMHPQTWWKLTQIYSCCIDVDCAATAGAGAMTQVANYDARELQRSRNQVMREKILFVNGQPYQVVLDSFIPLYKNALDPTFRTGIELADANLTSGDVWSPIFVLPLTYAGNSPATYIEYLDWSQLPEQLAGIGSKVSELLWSDDGKYIWALELVKWCLKTCARIVWRVILRTPHLAMKMVKYQWTPDQLFSYAP